MPLRFPSASRPVLGSQSLLRSGFPSALIMALLGLGMASVAHAQSDPTIGVLPSYNDVFANWSKAGLQSVGGIPHRTTVCATVNPTGRIPPTSADDAVAINNAIAACAAGDVVQLAAGTFQIAQSEYIALNKGVTLRGTGACTNASSPYCQTTINVYNGAIADWAISPTATNSNCGVTAASTS